MAYPQSRSCTANLHEGMTDGAWKKALMNRGGLTESDMTANVRRCMSGVWHGFNESPAKVLPDGRPARTPDFTAISPNDMENV